MVCSYRVITEPDRWVTDNPVRRGWHGPGPDTDPKEVDAMPEPTHPDNRGQPVAPVVQLHAETVSRVLHDPRV